MSNQNSLRKKQFRVALVLAGTTAKDWAKAFGVSTRHLDECLLGNRKPGEELDAAISAFIAKPKPPRKSAA